MPMHAGSEEHSVRRPWVAIVFLVSVAFYLLYATGSSALYFLRHDVPMQNMKAYLSSLIVALVCLAAAVGMYRGSGLAIGFGRWLRGGVGAWVGAETPGWIAVSLLLWVWLANAAGSVALWMLSIGNPLIGFTFVASNLAGILLSLWLFLRGGRAMAIKCAAWVLPLTLLAWFLLVAGSGILGQG